MQSCTNCPSYLTAAEYGAIFGKSVASPGCARFGHVLGRPGLSDKGHEAVAESFGANCAAYGDPRPTMLPTYIDSRVTNTDTSVTMAGPTNEALASCRGCKNCIHQDAVYDEMGWPADLCAAFGTLILKPTRQCRGCEFASAGNRRNDCAGLEMRAEFKEGFTVPVALITKAIATMRLDVHPSEYPTDLEVDPADQAAGVRAWRKVLNPEDPSREPQYAPIFRADFFDEIERAKIPQAGAPTYPDLYVDYNNILYSALVENRIGKALMLIGSAGTGKTSFYEHLGYLCQLPYTRVSINGSTQVEDLVGKFLLEGGETIGHVGRLAHAYIRPGVMVIDEWNAGTEDVKQLIRPMLDSHMLYLDQLKGQGMKQNDALYLGMAINPEWDARNSGIAPLSDADGRRVSKFWVEHPPETIERAILVDRCSTDDYEIDANTLNIIMKIAADLREMSHPDTGSLPITWGVAPNIEVAIRTKYYSVETAYRRAVTDMLEQQTADLILNVVRDHAGRK